MKNVLMPVLLVLLLSAATVGAQPYENASVVGQVQDRVLVHVKEGITLSVDKSGKSIKTGLLSLDNLSERFEVKDIDQLFAGMTSNLVNKADAAQYDRVFAVDFPEEMGVKSVKAAYEALPEVEKVELIDICRNYDAYLPNDPGLNGNQYYLRNSDVGGADLRAVGAWNQAVGDSNVIVAVIDSGVDWHHPDLGGTHPDKVNGAIWTNWTEYYGTPGVDDDNNGKIDDIRGWDFVNVPGDGWPGEDVAGQDNDPMDFESHGTNCAGLVAAITNNSTGIAGTAPGCKIMALRAGWLPEDSNLGVVRMDFVGQAILYAINNGARIINASWGSSSVLASYVGTALYNNVLIVNAAGNDNSSSADYLGTRYGVLCVAATNEYDSKAGFSNYGSWVELSAPGDNIYTTAYNHVTDSSTYDTVDGTSFASPIAAGAAALVLSANPGYNYAQISEKLMDYCDNIDAQNPGYVGLLGAGRINLFKSLGGDRVHRFPDEFPTLFDAMNCSVEGDTLAFLGGITINESADILDKGLQVLGGFDASFTTRDPIGNPTTLDGGLGPVLQFDTGVDTDTVVDGFILQGGSGIYISGIPGLARAGGGLFIDGVSPTVRNLSITNNHVGNASTNGCGGGILILNSTVTLENISVYGNSGVQGAGVYAFESDVTLINCDIYDNTTITNSAGNPAQGGGVHVVDSDLVLENCRISGHTDLIDGGGLYAGSHGSVSNITATNLDIYDNTASASGCGLYMSNGELDLTSVRFNNNVYPASATYCRGGGLFLSNVICDLDSLEIQGSAAHIGGGLYADNCPTVSLTNSIAYENSALFFGGGIYLDTVPNTTLTGNTVTANAAPANGAAGIYGALSTGTISNNIIAFNTGGAVQANGLNFQSSTVTVSCNDVFGNDGSNYGGIPDPTGTDGNISVDPGFCDMDANNFGLTLASPCTAANSGGCGQIGALGTETCSTSVPDDGPTGIPTVFRIEQNYPNPFNPTTHISFSLAEAAQTRVAIYDVAGRLVKVLTDAPMTAASHTVTWSGRDDSHRQVAAGVYFYEVRSGDQRAVGRMALVK